MTPMFAGLVEAFGYKTLREHIKPAEALFRANEYAESQQDRTRRRAEAAYKTIIKQYPDSPARPLALEKLQKLNPQAAEMLENEVATESPVRIWSDSSGQYELEAQLVEVKNGEIAVLKKKDGTTIEVPT